MDDAERNHAYCEGIAKFLGGGKADPLVTARCMTTTGRKWLHHTRKFIGGGDGGKDRANVRPLR